MVRWRKVNLHYHWFRKADVWILRHLKHSVPKLSKQIHKPSNRLFVPKPKFASHLHSEVGVLRPFYCPFCPLHHHFRRHHLLPCLDFRFLPHCFCFLYYLPFPIDCPTNINSIKKIGVSKIKDFLVSMRRSSGVSRFLSRPLDTLTSLLFLLSLPPFPPFFDMVAVTRDSNWSLARAPTSLSESVIVF